jgi:peptide/nickel transport system substrate-binding protein
MSKAKLSLFVALIVGSLIFGACAPQTTAVPAPTQLPAATNAASVSTIEPTTAPTEAPLQPTTAPTEALATAAAEPTTTSPTPKFGGTAIIATTTDHGDIQPLTSTDDFMYAIAVNIFNKLVKFAPDWSLVPDLATTWDISADGLTYTFHLRPNVKFHDGTPLTSDDVKFSMDYFTTKGAMASSFTSVKSIEAPDANTVVVQLSEPNAPFLSNLAWGGSMILPKHLYGTGDLANNPYNKKPVGTGPFKFVEYVPNDHVTLEANLDYYDGRPYLDKLIFKFIPQPETAKAAYDNGEVDALGYGAAPGFADVGLYKDRTDSRVIINKLPAVWRVAMNVSDPILKNVKVRQAIAYALDNKKIVETAFGGIPVILTTANPVPPSLAWAYNPDVAAYPYDPQKAAQLLDEAGYPVDKDGIRFKTTAKYATWIPGVDEWWQLVQEMLGKVGIKMDLVVIDTPTWMDAVVTKRDFAFTLEGGVLTDPDLLRTFYATNGGENPMGYSNADVDKLLDEGSKVSDSAKRAEAYFQAEKIIADEVPSIPIFSPGTVTVWNSKFDGQFLEYFYFDQSKVFLTQ